jgi:curli biogenesis system outer membrane secretion channel CsgG
MIDTSTSEILLTGKGEGTSKRSGLLLGGAGGGGGGGAGGGLNFGASDFKSTIIGEATDAAVKDTFVKLLAHKDRLNGGF